MIVLELSATRFVLLVAIAVMLTSACADSRPDAADGPPADTSVLASRPHAMPAPLPTGDWDTVYSGDQEIVRGVSHRSIYASREQGVIDRLVLVYRIELGKRYEFLPRTNCSSPDYFYATTEEGAVGSGGCWHVRAVNLGLAGDPHWVNLVLAHYAQSGDLYLPAVMVGVRFIRYHEGQLLQVDYLWNADLLLPPPAGHVWTPDDWNNASVALDPAKQVIMQTLQRWGEQWQSRLSETQPH
jgi:hypothetical protein